MAKFDDAIPVVLGHEGGFVDDPVDHGGATNMGITLRLFREWAGDHRTVEDLRALSHEDALAIYRGVFWDHYGYDRFTAQEVATKIFDVAVNMGPRRAHRIAQLAACRAGHEIICDGVLGPASVSAINACRPSEWLRRCCEEQRDFYRRIVAGDPTQARFQRGWLARAAWPFSAPATMEVA